MPTVARAAQKSSRGMRTVGCGRDYTLEHHAMPLGQDNTSEGGMPKIIGDDLSFGTEFYTSELPSLRSCVRTSAKERPLFPGSDRNHGMPGSRRGMGDA